MALHFPYKQVQAPLEVFPLYYLITICSNQVTYYLHFTDENLKKGPKKESDFHAQSHS